jgi:hypothetical protein
MIDKRTDIAADLIKDGARKSDDPIVNINF